MRQGKLNPHQFKSFIQHKTRNWWCQSFLVGIQDLYVGMRNEKGFVEDIEHIEMRSLPKLGGVSLETYLYLFYSLNYYSYRFSKLIGLLGYAPIFYYNFYCVCVLLCLMKIVLIQYMNFILIPKQDTSPISVIEVKLCIRLCLTGI